MIDYKPLSLQEVCQDPLGFFKLLNQGQTLTVTYHAKPYASVVSADPSTMSDRRAHGGS